MNILFLCTGNSARSILGEVIFNSRFADQGRAYSAGSRPTRQVNPAALATLQKHGHDITGLRSKPVDEFTGEDAPAIDLVISVCDSAARDCVTWPGSGNPRRLCWPLPDPATVESAVEKARAFKETYQELSRRIAALMQP